MSKKSVIICICVVLALLSFVGAGVVMLYSDRDGGKGGVEAVQLPVALRAVPSDAAVVFSFENARSGVSMLSDRSQLLHILASTDRCFQSMLCFMDDTVSVKAHPMTVSLHRTGTLEPLMVLELGAASDTTDYRRKLLDAAEFRGLACSIAKIGGRSLLLLSPSGSLVESSLRHLDGGASVLDDDSFWQAAASVASKNAVFFSNAYAGKLISTFCTRALYPYSTFIKNYAEWVALGIEDSSKKHLLMSGVSVPGKNSSRFSSLFESLEPGESRFSQVAPSSCIFAVDVAVRDFDEYYRAYERYLDASMAVQKHRRRLDTLAAHAGISPLAWVKELGVQEFAKVVWPSSDALSEAVMLRLPRQQKTVGDLEEFAFGEFIGEVFGPIFGCEDASRCLRRGEWLFVGSESALNELNAGTSLQDALSKMSESHILPQKGVRAVVWFSAGEAPDLLANWFRPAAAGELRATLEGSSCEPVVLSLRTEGLTFESVRPAASSSSRREGGSVSVAAGVDVSVPEGPFEVTNCATGKKNLFYQNPNLYLCLKDAGSGKGLWGVPFDKPICGSVACIDYYSNGKLQFLFGAGSSIYLIDRLGRFVKGFPVDLGKEILVGPGAYDVTGAVGPVLMVLHKDNTIGMYDISGHVPSSWKGIAPKATILSLPERITCEERDYWTVETSDGRLVYESYGGEPLKGKALKNLNLN